MLLATKCPHCKTTFKVANDQLKLQSGLVRCGVCSQVFNGIEHLAPANTAASTIKVNAPTPAVKPEPAKLVPAPPAEREREFDLFDEFKIAPQPPGQADVPLETKIEPRLDLGKEEQVKKPEPQEEVFFPDMLSDEFHHTQPRSVIEANIQALLDADLNAHQDLAAEPEPAQDHIEEIVVGKAQDHDQTLSRTLSSEKPASLRALLGNHADDDHDERRYDDEDEIAELGFIRQANRKKWVNLILVIATVLLFVALIGQGSYQFRDWIAASYPASKDALVSLCRLANCQVNLPASLDAISYEADELHTLPRENTFEFSLLLRNHSGLPQAWPHIELTLKDGKKDVVLKRVLTPAEYLGNARDVAGGFAANSEQPVKLYFTVDQVKASDYVVAIFYP